MQIFCQHEEIFECKSHWFLINFSYAERTCLLTHLKDQKPDLFFLLSRICAEDNGAG